MNLCSLYRAFEIEPTYTLFLFNRYGCHSKCYHMELILSGYSNDYLKEETPQNCRFDSLLVLLWFSEIL